MKLDRFSDMFDHNKDRYYHPKRDLNYSPSNIIFIDEKIKASKRIKSGNARLIKPPKKIEFGPRLSKDRTKVKIDGICNANCQIFSDWENW